MPTSYILEATAPVAAAFSNTNGLTGNAVLNCPAATSGEYLLACIAIDGPIPTITPPASWNLIVQPGTVNPAHWVGYIKLSGNSASTYTWTISNSSTWAGTIIRITGADPTTFEDATATSVETGAGVSSVSIPSMTTVTKGTLLVASFAANAAGDGAKFTAPTNYTEIHDSAAGKALGVDTRTWMSSGATGTVDSTYTGSSRITGVLVAIRPDLAVQQDSYLLENGSGIYLTEVQDPEIINILQDYTMKTNYQAINRASRW